MGVATYLKDEKDAIRKVLLQSGIEIKPKYTPEDLERVGFDYETDLREYGRVSLYPQHTPAGLPEPELDDPPVHGVRGRPRKPMNGSS